MEWVNIKDFIVYKHTCPNGKVYIGITCQKPQNRWGKDGNGYKEQLFYKAIKKYGWNNIKHEIIYENLTQKEAEEREKFLIEVYESYNKLYGYNIDLGGGGVKRLSEETKEKLRQANLGKKYPKETREKVSKALKGRSVSEETRKKISLSNKGKDSHFLGKHHTDETKQKLSKERTGKGNPMYGKHHTEEAKKKISSSNIGNKRRLGQKHSEETKQKMKSSAKRGSDNHASKKVICLNNDMVFDYMGAAAKWAGIKNSSDIGSVCMKKRKSAGKHPETKEPLRWSYYEEVIDE